MRSFIRNKQNKENTAKLEQVRKRLGSLKQHADEIVHSLQEQFHDEIEKATAGMM